MSIQASNALCHIPLGVRCLFLFYLTTLFLSPAQSQDNLLNDLDALMNNEEAQENAESSSDSLLDSLDSALESEPAQTSKDPQSPTPQLDSAQADDSILHEFAQNLSGAVKLRGWHYINAIETVNTEDLDTRDSFVYGMLELESGLRRDKWRVDIAGWVEGGNESYRWAGLSQVWRDAEERSRYAELNEMYLQLFFEEFDLTIGKRIFNNGLSPLFSPADRYAPRDYHDPLQAKKLGTWQVTADYYVGNSNITAAFFPVYQTSKTPAQESRWLAGSVDFDFTGLRSGNDEIQLIRENPQVAFDNFGYFLRGKTILSGWDLFASLYYGPNPLFALSIEHLQFKPLGDPIGPFAPQYLDSFDFVKSNPNVAQTAAGFSTTLGRWEIHGDLLYNHSPDGRDDSYLHYLAGFTYKISEWAKYLKLSSIDIVLDYTNVWITEEQYADRYLRSFGDYRYGNSELLGLIRFQVDPRLFFYVSSIYPVGRDDGYIQGGIERQFTDALSARFSYDHFYGPDDSDYGRWSDANRFVLSIEYQF